MTFVALAASGTASLESISTFFLEEAYNSAGGKNVVNVLLVDFRGYDTLLEIMVLGVASLSIYSMINLNLEAKDLGARLKFRKKETTDENEVELDDNDDNTKKYGNREGTTSSWDTVPLQSNDVLLQTTTKVVVFIILTFALHLFFAGHHNPGGGFIGGLVTAAALVLIALAFSTDTIRKALPIDFRVLTSIGLAIALLTGAGSFLFDAPFLSQTFGYFELPLLGETELATAMLFDIGVYLAVLGVTMTIILQIGRIADMEILMCVAVGILFAVAVFLILSRSLLRIVLGMSILTHGVHLLLITMSRLKTGAPPLLGEQAERYVDPLPQALILTSIVINFGLTAFFFVLSYRSYLKLKTDDMEEVRGRPYE